MGYVDLHSHVLPGLDDGAADIDASMTMLNGLARMGYAVVSATPHQKASQFLPALDDVRAAFDATVGRVAQAGLGLRLALAAENFWDDVFFDRWRARDLPSYDGGRPFLFEITPAELPARLEETLFDMALAGKLPVMAHPERYRPFWNDLERLARIGHQAALVVDLGAVAGMHGFRETRVARRLVAEGIAHAVATDVHSPADLRAAGAGIAWIKKRLGDGAARRLLEDNPAAILAGELPG